MPRWYVPFDPDCPEVERFLITLYDDPMTSAMGAPTDDITTAFARRHIGSCERCQEYGAANIEVV
jgi:hypothetical protein